MKLIRAVAAWVRDLVRDVLLCLLSAVAPRLGNETAAQREAGMARDLTWIVLAAVWSSWRPGWLIVSVLVVVIAVASERFVGRLVEELRAPRA